MEIWRLRYFQAVAEELSFSRAARRLHVTQPSLTRAVQQLESELGAELLTRTRRNVSITAAGAVLLQETGLLLQRLEEAQRRTCRTASGEEGVLRLGYIGPPTEHFLGSVLRQYRAKYPQVSLVLEERTPERIWEMVEKRRLEMGITRPVLAGLSLGLQTDLIRKEPLCVVLPAQHPLAEAKALSWSDLQNQPLILLARREGAGLHETILKTLDKAKVTPSIAYTPSLMSTVMTYVEAGAGVGVTTDSVSRFSKNAALKSIPLLPTATVDLVLVWAEKHASPTAMAFRSMLLSYLKSP